MKRIFELPVVAAIPAVGLSCALLGLGVAALPAHGDGVPITNSSFEQDDVSGLANQLNADIVPSGWTAYDDGRNNAAAGNARGLVYHGPGTSVVGQTLGQNDGSQSFFSAQRDIYQVLSATLEADTTYTLKVAIGDRNVTGAGGNVGDNRIHLGTGAVAGTNILATLDSASPGAVPTANGGWVTWTLTYTTGPSPAGLGEPLRIELTTDTNVGWFDNVRLMGGQSLIQNHSFECDVIPRDGNTGTVGAGSDDYNPSIVPTGWTEFDDGRNNGSNSNLGIVSSADDSFFVATLANTPEADANDQSYYAAEGDIYQVLPTTLQADTTYTITVDVGNRDFPAGGSPGTPIVNLGYGSTPGSDILLSMSQTDQPTAPAGGWVEWTAQVTTGAAPAGLGEALRIELTNGTNAPFFDNVRLAVAVTPPPPFQLEILQSGDDLVLSWPSQSGKVYDLLGSTDPEADGDPDSWSPVDGQEEIAATPDTNTRTIPRPAEDAMFYVVRGRDPSPASDPITVILLAGQSNMLGSGTVVADLPAALQAPQTDIQFTYGGAAGSISGLTSLQPGSGLEYGPEIIFGRDVADANPTEEFALIKYGDSGSDLENNWDPAGGSSHSAFVSKVTQGMNALTAAGYTPTISAMLWTQGERDARQGFGPNYETNLNAFITDIRTRYGEGLPFFISQLSSLQTDLPATGLADVRAAQANVAAADANRHLIVTDSFDLRSDDLHFSSAGQISLGEAFAASYQAAVGP